MLAEVFLAGFLTFFLEVCSNKVSASMFFRKSEVRFLTSFLFEQVPVHK